MFKPKEICGQRCCHQHTPNHMHKVIIVEIFYLRKEDIEPIVVFVALRFNRPSQY